ncbi:cell division protein PerM [Nocardioides dilutus]
MTALLPDRETRREAKRSAAEVSHDLRHRRPLVLLALLAGVLAAAGTLMVCLAIGVAGWFLTDAGAHGAPRDGLRTGALAWLMAHGSGVRVDGVLVSVIPLGITAVCAWATWRTAHRLGDSVSGHGPDADRIADGERDWTVPVAAMVFTAGYVATAVGAGALAATPATGPDIARVMLWSVVLCGLFGVPAIAAGSGRAAVWGAWLPTSVVSTAAACRSVLTTWVGVCLAFFVGALVLDLGTALNLVSQLGTDGPATALLVVVSVVLVPNATVFSGAYLLGPGFTVGVQTIVSPAEVTVGALPVFPMLAALPDSGPTPGWTPWLVLVPPVIGAVGAARAQRRRPTLRYEEGALHGCAGGMLAGAVFGVLASLAGGAVGPGRMTEVGPLVGSVLVHAVTAFGIGGLLGGLAITWWQRASEASASEPAQRRWSRRSRSDRHETSEAEAPAQP